MFALAYKLNLKFKEVDHWNATTAEAQVTLPEIVDSQAAKEVVADVVVVDSKVVAVDVIIDAVLVGKEETGKRKIIKFLNAF